MKLKTITAHAGICTDTATGAVSTPIYQTATFRHESLGSTTGYDYSRTANPTRRVLEDTIKELEGGAGAFAFSSGMAAITAVLMLFTPGDHLIISDDLYGGTYRLMEKVFKHYGIVSSYVDTGSTAEIERHLCPATKGIFVETPTNPLMKITDLATVAEIARACKLLTIVDNTFMTPYFQRPLAMGADIVLHSGTKYLGGHNDVLCGLAVAGSEELSVRLAFFQNSTGGILSPMDSWLMLRGIKTLAIRLEQQQKNAMTLAAWLQDHREVKEIYYPGLAAHPGHDIHKRNASGYGGMLSFRVTDKEAAANIINGVKLIPFAESLGGVETLITYPAIQTHADIPADMRERMGITDDLLRLSVGIEDPEDLIADLDQAMGWRK